MDLHSDLLGLIAKELPLESLNTFQLACKKFRLVAEPLIDVLRTSLPSRGEVLRWIRVLDFEMISCVVCWVVLDGVNSRLLYLNLHEFAEDKTTNTYITWYTHDSGHTMEIQITTLDIVGELERIVPMNAILAPRQLAAVINGRRNGDTSGRVTVATLANMRIMLCRTVKELLTISEDGSLLSHKWVNHKLLNTQSGLVAVRRRLEEMMMDVTVGDLYGYLFLVIDPKVNDVRILYPSDVSRWVLNNIRKNRTMRMAFYEKNVAMEKMVIILCIDENGVAKYYGYCMQYSEEVRENATDIFGGELQEREVPIEYRLGEVLRGRVHHGLDPITRARVMLDLGWGHNAFAQAQYCLYNNPVKNRLDHVLLKNQSAAKIHFVSFLVRYWCGIGSMRGSISGKLVKNTDREYENNCKSVCEDFKRLLCVLRVRE